jgi:hypothetical protein
MMCAQVDAAGNPLMVGPPASASLANPAAATTTAAALDLLHSEAGSAAPGGCSSSSTQHFKSLTATQRR